MYAIVTILDEPTGTIVHDLWQELEDRCGLSGIRAFPIPHFSWQGAEAYDIEAVGQVLDQIAAITAPWSIQADGLGLFTGPEPVIYVPLSNSLRAARLHRTIWKRVKPSANHLNPLYAPGLWMPHITLGLMDVNHEKLICAVRELTSRPLMFTLEVNNLALVSQEGDQVGLLQRRFDFKGVEHGQSAA